MKETDDYNMLKLSSQLCFPLYACARKIVNLYTPYLKPLGLTYTQYIAFMVLWETDGITVGELCRRLYLDNGTLTPLLKKMEKEGYITRTRESSDERVVTIRLTDKGRNLREEAVKIPPQMAGCVNMPKEDAEKLYSLLYKMLEL